MKEIDFLPDWYKDVRRQQVNYRTQYVGLVGLFVLMLMSNFVTSRSISRVQGQISRSEPMETAAKKISTEYAEVSRQIAVLQKKADVLKQIDSKVNVADVLSELSFLTGKKVVLTKVELISEKVKDQQALGSNGGFAVRTAGSAKEDMLLGNVKFKVVLDGIAAGAGDVGQFVCRLEDSPYFCAVYPAFTRNKQIKTVSSVQAANSGRISREQDENIQVNEFEIGCYLANFVEK